MADLTEGEKRDLDETRRLLYMVILAPMTAHAELAATVVNALIHHQGLDTPATDVIGRLVTYLDGDGGESWLWDRIQDITNKLSGPGR
jgi:hypothetical protein